MRCPPIDTCPPTMFFHERTCALYYECISARPQERRCAKNLHFSEKWQGCVNPSVSECNDLEVGSCREGEYLPHECKCTKFYECKQGWKVLRNCPSGWHFSKNLLTCIEGLDCDFDNPVQCSEGDEVAHECQCDKYYLCKNGRKALRNCPVDTGFDPELRECVPGFCEDNDKCINEKQKKHDCKCEKYYTCKNKEWVVQECPYGYRFSPERLICLPKREVRCDNEKNGPEAGECPIPNPTQPWPHECDCRLYYTCRNGVKEVNICSWGYYFDQSISSCNPAQDVSTCRNHWDDWL